MALGNFNVGNIGASNIAGGLNTLGTLGTSSSFFNQGMQMVNNYNSYNSNNLGQYLVKRGAANPYWYGSDSYAPNGLQYQQIYNAFDQKGFNPNQQAQEDGTKKASGFLQNLGSNIGGQYGGVVQAAGAVTGMVGDIVNSAKSKVKPLNVNYNINGMRNYNDLSSLQVQQLDSSKLHKQTEGEAALNVGKKIAQGAAIGTQISPGWGTLIGGVVGLAGGVGDVVTKDVRYKKDRNRIGILNEQYRGQYQDALNEANSNMNRYYNNNMNSQRLRSNTFAQGGKINEYSGFGVNIFGNGGRHEENPNGGVPQGIGANGEPNFVEEGEVKWNDFVFSKRIKPDADVLKQFNSGFNKKFNSYADIANKILDLHKEHENNPYDKQTLSIQMSRLAKAQEYQKMAEEAEENGMSVEEYSAYLQQMEQQQQMQQMEEMQAQQMQQQQAQQQMTPEEDMQMQGQNMDEEQQGMFAYGGNMFADGGDEDFWHKGQYDGFSVRDYWQKHNGKDEIAWRIDKYLESMMLIHEKSNPTKEEQDAFAWHTKKVVEHLKSDPEAQMYFLARAINAFKMNPQDAEDTLMGLRREYGIPTIQKTTRSYSNGSFRPSIHTYYTFGDIPEPLEEPDNDSNDGHIEEEPQETPVQRGGTGSYGIRGGGAPQQNIHYYDPTSRTIVGDKIDEYSVPINFIRSGQNYNGLLVSNPNDFYTNWWNSNKSPELEQEFFDWYNSDEYNPTNDINGVQYKKWTPTSTTQLMKEAQNGYWGAAHQAFRDFIWNRIKPTGDPASENQPTEPSPAAAPLETKPATSENPQVQQEATVAPTQPSRKRFDFLRGDPLRYAPVANGLRAVLEQNEPDFTYANQIASLYQPTTYRPTGQYERYQPLDQHYMDTQANQQRNTLYGFYRNNTPNAASANLYATMAANNARSAQHDAYLRTMDANNQMRNAAIAYNNQIDAANINGLQGVRNYNNQNYTQIMQNAYSAMENEKLAVENARETNRQNLANALGKIGKENTDYYYVSNNPALLYKAMGIDYKN